MSSLLCLAWLDSIFSNFYLHSLVVIYSNYFVSHIYKYTILQLYFKYKMDPMMNDLFRAIAEKNHNLEDILKGFFGYENKILFLKSFSK